MFRKSGVYVAIHSAFAVALILPRFQEGAELPYIGQLVRHILLSPTLQIRRQALGIESPIADLFTAPINAVLWVVVLHGVVMFLREVTRAFSRAGAAGQGKPGSEEDQIY